MRRNSIVRAALFSRSDNESINIDKLYRMQQYCVANGYTITRTFYSEADILNCREDFDVIVCCGEQILLPLAGIRIENIEAVK